MTPTRRCEQNSRRSDELIRAIAMTEREKYETLDPENWEHMRKLAHRMVDDALDYIETAGERAVWNPVPIEVEEALTAPAPREPSDPGAVYDEFLTSEDEKKLLRMIQETK